jgi:hypothetical protein
VVTLPKTINQTIAFRVIVEAVWSFLWCDGQMTELRTIEDVVARMRAVDAALPPDDGVAVFNRLYLRVTEMVLERLSEGAFHDAAFMAELDLRFAGLWFAAYDAPSAAVPHAWAPLFEQRATSGLLPIQFAFAGMNAHIEHDLPLAVVATCSARGRTPTSPGVHEDYEKVNDLLAGIEADIRRSFLTEVERAADDSLGPVAHLVSSWNIDKARDVAWVTTNAMWALRSVELLAAPYEAALARSVGMGSRLLLTPVVDGSTPNLSRSWLNRSWLSRLWLSRSWRGSR